jgi:hypothetical protein
MPRRGWKERRSPITAIAPDLDSPILLPVQRAARTTTSERRLLLAVLEEAVREHAVASRSTGRGARRRMKELTEWFACEDESWPFSFPSICVHLGIDRGFARRRIGLAPDPMRLAS